MSGNIQPSPTATMTVSGGQAGISPVGFGYYPAEGSRVVSAQYSWATLTGYAEDLSGLVARGVQTAIQSAFVDNSTNPNAVTITVLGTDQVVVVPANSQGVFPLFFTGAPGFTIAVASTNAGVTRLYLLNVPSNTCGMWKTV
jgi:hypothetical protein